LANTLAEEFAYHQPNGKTNDKPGYIKQMQSGAVKIFSAERYDVKVNLYWRCRHGNGLNAAGRRDCRRTPQGRPALS